MMPKPRKPVKPAKPVKNRFEAIKTVKLVNTSFQGLEVFIKDGRGFKSYWLSPGSSIDVLEKDIPEISYNLIKKRMLSIVK